jgi:hypothetical protein
VVNVSSLLKHTLDARKSAGTDPHRDAIVGNGATDAFQNHGHPCDATPVPLSSDKILSRDVDVGGFQRGRADHAISFANHLDGLALIQITTDGAIRKEAWPCMRHATGFANVSGLRNTCTAFCSVQVAASVADESEQIRIKAVSILFPLAFLDDCSKIAGTQIINWTQASKNYAKPALSRAE